MQIETDRLVLRRWQADDKLPFRLINADPKVTEFYPSPCSIEASDQIITRAEAHFDKFGFGLFAVVYKPNTELLGFVGLQNVPFDSHFTPAVEIGWRIAPKYWNQGIATEAAKAVLDFGFSQLGLKEIVALTAELNQRSMRVMEKLGMTFDPNDSFENPRIEEGHPLRPHVLYRIRSNPTST